MSSSLRRISLDAGGSARAIDEITASANLEGSDLRISDLAVKELRELWDDLYAKYT